MFIGKRESHLIWLVKSKLLHDGQVVKHARAQSSRLVYDVDQGIAIHGIRRANKVESAHLCAFDKLIIVENIDL